MPASGQDTRAPHAGIADRLERVVPHEIRAYKQWLVWRYEPGTEKPRKVPYYVGGAKRSGMQGGSSDLASLCTFDQAVRCLRGGHFDGIGLAVLENSPIKAIDLDNCVDDGRMSADAEAIVTEADSYTELSPSGNGVRILVYGVLPSKKAMNYYGPGKHVELFGTTGFVTVTGNVVGESVIRPMSPAFQSWITSKVSNDAPIKPAAPQLALVIDERQRADLRSALNYLKADDYAEWIDIGMALKSLGDVGLGLWLEWSQLSNRYDAKEAADKWRSFEPTGKINYQTVFYRADTRGWVNPASGGSVRIGSVVRKEEDRSSALPLVFAEDVSPDQVGLTQIVEDTLTAGGLSVMYGESNSGKSFLACDMDCSIASGSKWLGKRTVQGAVLYVAGEGSESIKMRVLAWKQHHGINPMLAVIPVAINLLDPAADVSKVIDAAATVSAHYGMPVTKITIDTLARAFGGGNENASEDMGAVIANADRIRAATKAHVMAVHHAGKDAAKGSRGHSSLKAATDTEIEVTAEESTKLHTARITKQRDLGSRGEEMTAKFSVVEMGKDQWGKAITTCVVEATDLKPAGKATKKRGAELREAIKDVLLEQANRTMKRGDLVKRLQAAGFTSSPIYRAIKDMAEDKEVNESMNLIHLVTSFGGGV